MRSDAIQLTDPSAEIVSHVSFKRMDGTGREGMGNNLPFASVLNSVSHIKDSRDARDECLIKVAA